MVKRSAEAAELGIEGGGEGPPPKHRRISEANLNHLPLETVGDIYTEIVDLRDPVGTIQEVASLRRVNRNMGSAVDFHLWKNDALPALKEKLIEQRDAIDSFAAEPFPGGDRVSLRLFNLIHEADQIPLRGRQERSRIVTALFKHEKGKYAEELALKILDNMTYLTGDERRKMASLGWKMCDGEDFFRQIDISLGYLTPDEADVRYPPGAVDKDFLHALTRQADHLLPHERSRVVNATCNLSDPDKRRLALEEWADKADLLQEGEQRAILQLAGEPNGGRGRSLARFAANINMLSSANQSKLVEQIGSLPHDEDHRFEALSLLARNLKKADGAVRAQISSALLDGLNQPDNESFGPDREWQSHPLHCRLETLHHLFVQRDVLDLSTKNAVDAFIRMEIGRSGDEGFVSRSHLIVHLPGDERAGFVGNVLQNTSGQTRRMAHNGLAARIGDLDKQERRAFFVAIRDERLINAADSINYLIREKLDSLSKSQRTWVVERQRSIIESRWDDYAGRAFADIAQNGRHLRYDDVKDVVQAAKNFVGENVDDMPTDRESVASVRSCAGHAARCVANWGGRQLEMFERTRQSTRSIENPAASVLGAPSVSDHQGRERDRAIGRE